MRILLAVSGSISAYKAYDLCRELFKRGHEIKVVLTTGSEEFIKKETFKYLGASAVYTAGDDFDTALYAEDERVLHISLSKWAEKLVIAPLSANTLSRLASGSAHDLLGSLFLATPKETPIIVFPAMNPNMLSHPMVVQNFETLRKLSNIFIHPTAEGEMVCGDEGAGKLADIFQAIDFIESFNLKNSGKKILITTGATRAPLDPVRYLTNPSTGLTGYELAKYYLSRGHKVTVVAGLFATSSLERLLSHPNFTLVRVETTQEMYEKVMQKISDTHLFIASAAVCDMVFEKAQDKIKKDTMSDSIRFEKAVDILKSVIELKKENLKTVGFAAETNINEEILRKKWKNKPSDLLIGNFVSNGKELRGFNSNKGEFTFFQDNKLIGSAVLTKTELANFIEQKVKF